MSKSDCYVDTKESSGESGFFRVFVLPTPQPVAACQLAERWLLHASFAYKKNNFTYWSLPSLLSKQLSEQHVGDSQPLAAQVRTHQPAKISWLRGGKLVTLSVTQ